MRCELCRRHDSIAIANLDRRMIALKVVAENLVVVAKEADAALGFDKEVTIDQAMVTVAKRKFGAVFAKCVEAVRVFAGFIANRTFVFAASLQEQVVFHKTVRRRQASRTVADVKRG